MKYLGTRDLYKRQCELREDLDTFREEISDAEEHLADAQEAYQEATISDERDEASTDMDTARCELQDAKLALAEGIDEYQEELDELNALEREVGDEWMRGENLIPESEWVNYVQNLAEDIGATAGADHSWLVIDWEATADDVRMDYSECEYQGDTYLFRS